MRSLSLTMNLPLDPAVPNQSATKRTATMTRSPQVRINVENLDKLMELTDAQMRVWLYYKRREGADGKAFGKAKTIAAWTKCLEPGTVRNNRAWLTRNGWLKPNGKSKSGLPQFLAVIPELHLDASECHPTITQLSSTNDTTVIPELHQVSSQREPEVYNHEALTKSTNLKHSVLTDGGSQSGSEPVIPPSADRLPTASQEPIDHTTWTNEEQSLMFAITPICHPSGSMLEDIQTILTFCGKVDVDPQHILRWNRVHKSGALQIRNTRQFLAALLGNGEYKMLNDYKTHSFLHCKMCRENGIGIPVVYTPPETTRECHCCGYTLDANIVHEVPGTGYGYCVECLQKNPYLKDELIQAKAASAGHGFEHEDAE